MTKFYQFIDRVLGHEGGYSTDRNDPGGETKWGISKRSYPNLDIPALTRAQAVEIYRRDFWDRVHGDEMPAELAFQALDFAVNSGAETALRYTQRVLGVADDGHWGPVTRAAAQTADGTHGALLLAERLDFMRRTKNWVHHGNGWAGRIAQNLRHLVADVRAAVAAATMGAAA
jgi:lysozyme family protein